MIDGIEKVLLSGETNPVNIGNQDEVSIVQLAEEIIELTGSKSRIVFEKLPEDDPKIRQPDTAIARTKLKWAPTVGRREGLRRTIEYFRAKLGEMAK
jgi:dTDP-glucose 4,6-dehydratase